MSDDDSGTDTTATTVTLADVARAAGVSVATASKALNGKAHVSARAREAVTAAASALAFVPNPFARALNRAPTNTIGMLTSDLDNRFVLPILLGAEDAFGAGSLSVLLADARDSVLREQLQLQSLLTRRVDGVLVVGRTTNPRPPMQSKPNVPVVYVYAPSTDDQDLSFEPDNELAGRLAVDHLVAVGRRRIAIVNGEDTYAAARDRLRGAAAATEDHGLELVGTPGLVFGSWNEAWGRQATVRLLEAHPDVDAIVAGSDHIARGVMDAVRESGRRIPDDVAVVGFDNWDILVEGARPHLTSVDMNLQELGRLAAEALVDTIDGNVRRGRVRNPVQLVVRGSSAPAREPGAD
ncbi:LacI family DNA-binding transcriptional regulator [Curtobacterium sp. MCBA15_004]|uniref:LacI family DNA-binding transcriptional regulator n=1 Tax=unclassified Curtobacterium TaxID=257496 RepID=UPI0008DE2A1A|nr:LacI family DNA-binding transcriptional regulator [Curtobacterium sp. MCBA15_004]WIA97111.1 LacI family DNA-binding transcriptional regulator [Curtobacterium sp. MCBA15_004]